MNRCQIITGDCRQALKELPSGSVHACVTSPPYWGLRDYGHPDQIGQERTPEDYVATMVQVFREVRRVLRDDKTLWLNLGDSYSSGGRTSQVAPTLRTKVKDSASGKHANLNGLCCRPGSPENCKPKDLIGIPWMVAFALRSDGWYLRSDIIWHKPNPMPESVTDRPTKSHEYLFLMSKAERYFYDAEAIKETAVAGFNGSKFTDGKTALNGERAGLGLGPRTDDGTRNKRSVWTIPTSPYSEAHFATFPPDLIKPCILAGTSAKGCCPKCGAPWERVVDRKIVGELVTHKYSGNGQLRADGSQGNNGGKGTTLGGHQDKIERYTTGWEPSCECMHEMLSGFFPYPAIPCTVLDPFGGSGTTGQVALELGRKSILIELNPKYVTLIENRTHVTPGLPLA